MKLMEQASNYFSALGGKFLAGKKARRDEERNRKRLDEAALASRFLGTQRIADTEIKKMIANLVFEADRYIASARESEGSFYEPLVLDALDNVRAAVNVWKTSENEAAAGKYLKTNGMVKNPEFHSVVIPARQGSEEKKSESGDEEMRERTLGIIRESLRIFTVKNSIHAAGDLDAALASLAPEKTP